VCSAFKDAVVGYSGEATPYKPAEVAAVTQLQGVLSTSIGLQDLLIIYFLFYQLFLHPYLGTKEIYFFS